MHPVAVSIDFYLNKLTKESFNQIDGLPAEAVNAWRPAAGLEDVNTFFALLTHLVSSGEFWVLSVAAERPTNRMRASEFVATGDVDALRARAETWLSGVRAFLETLTGDDFGRVVDYLDSEDGTPSSTTIADCLVHAVDHTANHLGHLQLQRQIWNAETK